MMNLEKEGVKDDSRFLAWIQNIWYILEEEHGVGGQGDIK